MIHEIHIPDLAARPLGLKSAFLRGLDQVVLLAGPNGAGKSRYLRLISKLTNRLGDFHVLVRNAEKFGQKLTLPSAGSSDEALTQGIAQLTNLYAAMEKDTDEIEKKKRDLLIYWQLLRGSKFSEPCHSVFLDYRSLTGSAIRDRDRTNLAALKDLFDDVEDDGLKSAYRSIHLYLGYVAQILYDSEHPRAKSKIQQKHIESAAEFNRIIRGLLGTDVTYDLGIHSYVVPCLFNRPFAVNELSDGQLILLAWSIALHQQSDNLRESVLFIDEPETHLHADMCIEALERLRTEVLGERGQMWIATHCPAVLAHYGVQSLYYVKNGSIEYAGTGRVEEVMDSILGGRDGREKLATALLDAEHVAFASFAAQCILPPSIADHKSDDKQEKQFASALDRWLTEPGRTVRVLDFAAGKGRFATALCEQRSGVADEWRARIEYHAYNDPKYTPSEARGQCQQALRAFGVPTDSSSQRYWESLAELKASHREGFDLVVLANVLHEIEVGNWKSVLGDVGDLLSPQGRLLIIEDLLPPVGELPNMWGYVILDRCGVETLFGGQSFIRLVELKEDRLLAVEVTRDGARGVNHDRVRATLEYLKGKAHEEILKLRAASPDQRNHQTGRRHAHYGMLYTNASLALARL